MEESRRITRRSASNLALAFVLLPKAKRDAMSALYAFCREVDDIADNDSLPVQERRARLAAWREDIGRVCAGEEPAFRVNQELQPFVTRHRLPFELFDELIRGVEMDLEIKRYETFAQLEQYCYRVAVLFKLRERFVTLDLEVHFDAADQFIEKLEREPMPGHERLQLLVDAKCRLLPRADSPDVLPPRGQARASFLDGERVVVGDVIDFAAEG